MTRINIKTIQLCEWGASGTCKSFTPSRDGRNILIPRRFEFFIRRKLSDDFSSKKLLLREQIFRCRNYNCHRPPRSLLERFETSKWLSAARPNGEHIKSPLMPIWIYRVRNDCCARIEQISLHIISNGDSSSMTIQTSIPVTENAEILRCWISKVSLSLSLCYWVLHVEWNLHRVWIIARERANHLSP